MRSKKLHTYKIGLDIFSFTYLTIFCSFFLGYKSDKDIVEDSSIEYGEEYFRSIQQNHRVQQNEMKSVGFFMFLLVICSFFSLLSSFVRMLIWKTHLKAFEISAIIQTTMFCGFFYLKSINEFSEEVLDMDNNLFNIMIILQGLITAQSIICLIVIKFFRRRKKFLDVLMILMGILIALTFILSYYFFKLDRNILDILYKAYGGYRKGKLTFSIAFQLSNQLRLAGIYTLASGIYSMLTLASYRYLIIHQIYIHS